MSAAAPASAVATTREALQRVATHVLARRRHAVTGRFGLRATPGGFGTPAFGSPDALECLRVSGTSLVHEVGGDVRVLDLRGSSLTAAARFVGLDLDPSFSVGHDTPAIGDAGEPLALDPSGCAAVAEWFHLGWQALDAVARDAESPTAIQLWPEHFDAGCSVAVGPGPEDRWNLGVSAGDGFSDDPYLYVGPWSRDRPGDPSFWNAPFGAACPAARIGSLADAVDFFRGALVQNRGGGADA